MTLRVKAKIGDIFQIPLDDTRVGYGQVVMQPEKSVLFICIFSTTTASVEKPDLAAVVGSQILLAGNTFDGKLWHGHWPVVGNLPPDLRRIAIPKYKEGLPGQAFVESLDLTKRRRASSEEEHILPFRTYVAPIRFEKALRAVMKLAEWSPDYDVLKYEHVQRGSNVEL